MKMKNSVNPFSISLFIFCLIFSSLSFGQDKVLLLSGEVKEGKVTGITEKIVKFRYQGEDFDYEIEKTKISKITFASGRVEVFNNQNNPSSKNPNPQSGSTDNYGNKNKIAVLPFEFVTNEPGMTLESMRILIQTNTANIVKKEYKLLSLQDPLTTNSILSKNNITHENFASYSPEEIAQLLEVEFVILGLINIVNEGSSTYGSSVQSYKENTNAQNNSGNKKTTSTAVSSGNSKTKTNYDTTVDFRLFNDKGESLYSESRHAFGSSIDSYRSSIEYMVKRTPFGSKYGKK